METSERQKEQSVIQRINSNGFQSPCEVAEIVNDTSIDDTAVKSLKILAQICVDELKKCNESEMLSKENMESIYISSDSESDIISTGSTKVGAITGGGIKRSSCSGSETYSENESSSDSSSTDSDDSDDEIEDDSTEMSVTKEQPKIDCEIDENVAKDNIKEENDVNRPPEPDFFENSLPITNTDTIDVTNTNPIDDTNIDTNTNDDTVTDADTDANTDANTDVNAVFNTDENTDTNNEPDMIVENSVQEILNPISLKDMCRGVLQAHSMIQYDVPTLKYLCEHTMASAGMIYFVQEESQFLCVDSDFDETELANLFDGAGNGVCESVEICPNESESFADKTSLIDQCVALQNILSSPPPTEDSQSKVQTELTIDDSASYMIDDNVYEMNDGFLDSIQYEETVLPSESCGSVGKSFKKYLQKKYVQTSNYHKMFVINKLLRKYKVHQVSSFDKKTIVQQRLRKVISKLRQKTKQQQKPKKLATRRSARIADKIKQQQNDELDTKSTEKTTKSSKVNKNTKIDESKLESKDTRLLNKIMNMNDLQQNSGHKKALTDNDKESITRDLLKLIAKKRTLKRKLSICHRPTLNFDDDGYCYDEDGQISEMVSSYINNRFDEKMLGPSDPKKPRSRKPSLENKPVKEHDGKKRQNPLTKPKKQSKVEDKSKSKKSKEKNSKTNNSKTKTATELSLTESCVENKTEKKNTFLEPQPLTSTTKASVKEVVPAKRTRFLSIDGSLMKYGTKAIKSYNQMKSFKDKLDLQETTKVKNSSQKNSKKTAGAPVIKEIPAKKDVSKPKPIRGKRERMSIDSSSTRGPVNIKELLKSVEKAVQSGSAKQSKKTQIASETMKIPIIRSSSVKENDEKGRDMQKPEPTKVKRNEGIYEKFSKSPRKSVDDSNGIQKPAHIADKNHVTFEASPHSNDHNNEKDSFGSKMQSVENILDKSKMSNKKHEKPLSERGILCSTMVSPLKIIIEPKRTVVSAKDRIITKDPIAIKKDEQISSKPNQSSTMNQYLEGRKANRVTRFSDRITNHIETPAITTSESFPTFKKVNEDPRLKSPSERARVSAVPPTLTNTDEMTPVGSYLDIEQFLPSTRILQPKPGRRCFSRAQTISSAESPMRDMTFEPMQLRSSNTSWNQRKTEPTRQFSSHQFSRMPSRPMDSQFGHRRNQAQNATMSPRNVQSSFKAHDNWSKPNQNVPIQNTPNYNPPPQRTAIQNTLVRSIPTYNAAIQTGATTQNSPIPTAPIQNAWIQNSPVLNLSNHSSPILNSPVQSSPIQSSPNQNMSNQNSLISNKSVLKAALESRPILRTAIHKASIQNMSAQTKPIQMAPIKRTPIDMSTFPDPESLHIPLFDLRSPSSSRSPLSLPIGTPLTENKEKAPCMYFFFTTNILIPSRMVQIIQEIS